MVDIVLEGNGREKGLGEGVLAARSRENRDGKGEALDREGWMKCMKFVFLE